MTVTPDSQQRVARVLSLVVLGLATACGYVTPSDPQQDGRVAAEPYCGCTTAHTARLIEAHTEFQRDFDNRRFARRQEARDALEAALGQANSEGERCLAPANEGHERLRRRYIDDRTAMLEFESAVSQVRSRCQDDVRLAELGTLKAAIEKRIATIEDPGVDAASLLEERGHPGYQPTTDRDRDWDKFEWDQFVTPGRRASPDYPYVVRGDFDGDGRPDIAVDVRQVSSGRSRLAVVWGHGGVTMQDDQLCSAMSLARPKEWTSAWEPRPLVLTTDAILIECYEKSSFLLYWERGSFRQYRITD